MHKKICFELILKQLILSFEFMWFTQFPLGICFLHIDSIFLNFVFQFQNNNREINEISRRHCEFWRMILLWLP